MLQAIHALNYSHTKEPHLHCFYSISSIKSIFLRQTWNVYSLWRDGSRVHYIFLYENLNDIIRYEDKKNIKSIIKEMWSGLYFQKDAKMSGKVTITWINHHFHQNYFRHCCKPSATKLSVAQWHLGFKNII